MDNITVDKQQLIEIISVNRDNHRSQFEEAFGRFKAEVEKNLAERLKKIQKGKIPSLIIKLPVPVDHTTDYNRVIRMLELSVNDQIDLSEDDAAMYVMDEWDWSRQFAAMSASYGVRR
jgi:hypothetical protein